MSRGRLERLSDWCDEHEPGIDRGFFWWAVVWATANLAALVWAVWDREWVLTGVHSISVVLNVGLALLQASEIDLRRDGEPPFLLFVRRVRRWVHVALWGWSS